MKKILSAFLLGTALLTAGCDKEKVFFQEELNGAKTGAGFGLPNSEPLSLTVEASSTTVTEAINAFVSGGGSANVTLSVDESLVTAYNDANGTEIGVMPSDVYTLPSSISVSGGTGSSDATFDVQKLLTYGTVLAIGLKITNVSGGTDYVVPGNSELVIIVKVKNQYEGDYAASGARIRFNGGSEASGILDSFAINATFFYGTVDSKTINGQLGDAGSGYTMAVRVNDDGSVDVLPDPATVAVGGSPSSIIPGTARGSSTYNPDTKTFDLHFGYKNSSGNLREVNEKLVFKE